MGREKSERELKLQKKLIPVNIIVCILALVAALTLFLTPILSIDVGKILRDDKFMSFVEEQVDGAVDDSLEGTDQEDINYKPVVAMIIKNVLGKAEGEVSISAISAFNVLTGSGDKSQIVLDDLFFGDDALVTKLIDGVVEGVAEMFTTDEGKALLEEAVVSVMTKQILKETEDTEINGALSDALTTQNVKELVGILKEMETVTDGDVSGVADKFIDKVDAMLGDSVNIEGEDRQVIADAVQDIYNETKSHLDDGESVSMESIICVTISKNLDLSQIDIEELLNFSGILGGNDEGSTYKHFVDEELGGSENSEGTETGEGSEGSETGEGSEGSETGEGSEGSESGEGSEGGEQPPAESGNTIVTNYNDFLLEIGYDSAKKEELKASLRTSLNDLLSKYIHDNGYDEYVGYYQYLFFGMLSFIGPWVLLFLFSFFHLFAKNKRFTMWYVKLICWIPSVIWLALKLAPTLISKIAPDFWSGETGALLQSVLSKITTFTWISGLCYVLLWLVSIFWAFPIKHKIRKERKNPEVVDADDGYDGFGDY